MIRTKKYFEDKLKEAVSVDPKVMVIQELENYFKDKSQNYNATNIRAYVMNCDIYK